jgi:geranylgeranyl pyrophosphate synthase
MELGWVFQLRDDWLGYDKDMAKVGKKTYATMYGKEKTGVAVSEHMMKARESLQGLTLKVGLMHALVEWMGTREN